MTGSDNIQSSNSSHENLVSHYSPEKINMNDLEVSMSLVTEEYQSQAEEIECPICLNLVLDPTICMTCNQVFCDKCIKGCAQSNNKKRNPANNSLNDIKFRCPMNCESFQKGILYKPFLNMINKIKIKCPNGCKEIFKYEHIITHIENCNLSNYKCNGCGFKTTKAPMEAHIKQCEEIKEKCQICNIWKGKRKDREMHLEDCEMRLVICIYCLKEMTFKEKQIHNMHQCFSKIILFYEGLIKNKKKRINFFSEVYGISDLNERNTNRVNYEFLERTDTYSFNLIKSSENLIRRMVIVEFSQPIMLNSLVIELEIEEENYNLDQQITLKILSLGKENDVWKEIGYKIFFNKPIENFKVDCQHPGKIKSILIQVANLKFKILFLKVFPK
jgi:hypothetical protein